MINFNENFLDFLMKSMIWKKVSKWGFLKGFQKSEMAMLSNFK